MDRERRFAAGGILSGAGQNWTPLKGEAPARIGFFAQMIDHGFAFNGPHWGFQDSPLQGLYFRTSVYDEVRSLDSFEPWLEMVANFPASVIDSAWKEIPREWLRRRRRAAGETPRSAAQKARASAAC